MIPDSVLCEVAARHPTPFYCYDADIMRSRYGAFRAGLPRQAEVFYSAKANPNLSVLRVFEQLGAGIEVSSITEYRLARAAGVPARRIIFVGPGKSDAELQAVIGDGIALIIAESIAELWRIETRAAAVDRVQKVLLRVNPVFSIAAPRHKMSGVPTQFGIEDQQLAEAFEVAAGLDHVHVDGIQVYLGARVLDHTLLLEGVEKTLALAATLRARFGLALDTVDLGGGFGIPLYADEPTLDMSAFLRGFRALTRTALSDRPSLRLLFEIGRYLVGPAGVFVSTVLYEKACGGKRFVVCDGGASSHCSAAGYGNPNRRNWPLRKIGVHTPPVTPATLTGPLCTPLDTLAVELALPRLARGDLIRVDQSGAYGPTHSPVYFISHGFPAELMLDGEAVSVVRAADTTEDMLKKYAEERLGHVQGRRAYAQGDVAVG